MPRRFPLCHTLKGTRTPRFFAVLMMLVAAVLPHAVLGQASPAAPAASPAEGTIAPNPPVEDAFIKAVEEARATYVGGLNDLVRGVARPRRAEALCRVVPKGRVENWVGKVVVLGSSPGGKGVVAIEVAPKVTLSTNRTDAIDDKDKTLIDPRSPLFAYAAVLAVGDRVQFSGTLLPGTDDCFKEVGKDVMTSMSSPEFVVRFDALKKVIPPSANAVMSGQAKAMSIAQSSDYVRDSVDIIAAGVACGADNRRVFAIIIKVLIKATAGQPPDQRDALIGLMFTPPSASTQNKENCDAKLSALDRLEAEAS
jgi:hypothetical protein